MAAWGQTSAHLLHWMQIGASQTGISSARFRFSQRVVEVGQVPSAGKALTGRRSPLFSSITAVTLRTKSGASGATTGGRPRVAVIFAGTTTGNRAARDASTAA